MTKEPDFGPKTPWERLDVGARIYRTGTTGEAVGGGVIVARLPIDPKWQFRAVRIVMDDDYEFASVGLVDFQPGFARRFWLEDDWNEFSRATRRPVGSLSLGEEAEPATAIEVAPRQLALGDVLVSSWGYDQTNVDFYQVVAVTAKQATVRAIKADKQSTDASCTGTVTPVINVFTGKPLRRKIKYWSNSPTVDIEHHVTARLWNGKPSHFTAYA